jgi:hypothetical protein
MRFAIRDDDTNYFTQPEHLERVYSEVWETCPVTLSVVPFQACTPSGAVPREHWQGEQTFPIGENEALVEFLRERIAKGQVSISQHGFSHRDYPGGYEFEAGDDLARKICEGKQYLEDLFGVEVTVFVPPHNALSKRGWEAALRYYRRFLGPLPHKPSKRPWHVGNAMNFLRWRWFCLKQTGKWGPTVAYPFPLDYGRYAEFICPPLTPLVSLAQLQTSFDAARQARGSFCLATHCWEFNNPDMAETFDRFWRHVLHRTDDIEFVYANSLFGG